MPKKTKMIAKGNWVIQRPGNGISLNAGHMEVLRKGKKILTFQTKGAAVEFLVENKVIPSKRSLGDSTIEVVKQNQ